MTDSVSLDPHRDQAVLAAGEPLGRARAVVIMLHGRNARAEDILTLAEPLALPGFAYLAPRAANNSWYPLPYSAPLEGNLLWLTSALARVGALLAQAGAAGLPPERCVLLGFSQGASLAVEYAARNARRYGGIACLSGGLIGPPGAPRDDPGSLAGTSIFIGCSDSDPFIPREHVERSAQHLRELGGDVTERLYPHMDHSVNQDEIDFVRKMLESVLEVHALGG